jgi:hypothetical protein
MSFHPRGDSPRRIDRDRSKLRPEDIDMRIVRHLLAATLLAAIVATAYFVGAQSRTAEATPPPPAEPVLRAKPMDITIANPTDVLLGQAPVPNEALQGPVTSAPGLIVPEIPK